MPTHTRTAGFGNGSICAVLTRQPFWFNRCSVVSRVTSWNLSPAFFVGGDLLRLLQFEADDIQHLANNEHNQKKGAIEYSLIHLGILLKPSVEN